MDDTVGVSKNPNAWRIVFQSLAKRSSKFQYVPMKKEQSQMPKYPLCCLSEILSCQDSSRPLDGSTWTKNKQQRSIKTHGIIMASDGSCWCRWSETACLSPSWCEETFGVFRCMGLARILPRFVQLEKGYPSGTYEHFTRTLRNLMCWLMLIQTEVWLDQ